MTAPICAVQPRSGGHGTGRLLQSFLVLLPDHWQLALLGRPPREAIMARYGAVEIRQTEVGFAALTYVKGERDLAWRTALRRFCRLARSKHFNSAQLCVCQPLVQIEDAPGRWLARIALDGTESAIRALAARRGRVRVQTMPSETLAVLRLSGHATQDRIARGAAAIYDAIAASPWVTTGKPMVRLHCPRSAFFLRIRSEVAVRLRSD